MDATELARAFAQARVAVDLACLGPPYNQHPYSSNDHALNTITLWDRPELAPRITGRGDKAAIRRDWRTGRRSAYNGAALALSEYRRLLDALEARWIATSLTRTGQRPAVPAEALLAAILTAERKALAEHSDGRIVPAGTARHAAGAPRRARSRRTL